MVWALHIAFRMQATNSVIDLRATVDSVRTGDVFSGRTVVAYHAGDVVTSRVEATVEGELTDSLAMLDLHIQEGALSVSPFFCTGETVTEGERYEGKWRIPCLRPETCGCDGQSGYFSLKRAG